MTSPRPSCPFVALAVAWSVALAGVAQAQVRSWPSERPPKPLQARGFTFPSYDLRTLPNGLRVVVVPHHEQPAVSVQLLVRAGSAYDPPGKAGVANMVAALLDQGTARRTARDIADEIDTIGGDLSVVAGTDVIFAKATVMRDNLGAALDLLSDICREPAFAADELTRQMQQLRSALHVSYDDPDYVASVVFERIVYGPHPYGLPSSGTPQSIERITRDDLVGFHQRHFAPNSSVLAVVGDVTVEDAVASVEAALGGWERKDVPSAPGAELLEPARRVVVVHKPDAVQTEIRVGHVAIPRAHRDYLALDMAIRVLGGEGVNRLQQILRMSRGLTYGASADLLAYQVAGDITAETDTQSMTTAEAVRTLVDEVFRLKRETVEERELTAVKDYMTGSYPVSIETPGGIATKVLNALFFGLPLEELQDYRERVSAVSPDDISRVIRAHLRPDRLTVVLVGNAGAFGSQLRGVGLRDIEVIPVSELDLARSDLRAEKPAPAPRAGSGAPAPVPAAPVPVAPVPVAPVPAAPVAPPQAGDPQAGDTLAAETILHRAVEAAGGIENLRQVKTVRATAATVMHTPEGPLQTRTTTWVEYPGRVRLEAETSSGNVIQVYDAGHAWIQDSHGARDAPDGMRRSFAASAQRDWIALLLAAAQKQLTARALPEWRGVGGRLLLGVELTGAQLPATKLYVDAASAQLARIVYDTPGPRGNETTAETFSDFRLVDGVSVPFKAVVQRGSSPLIERTITGLVFNEPLPAGLFTKPGGAKPPR